MSSMEAATEGQQLQVSLQELIDFLGKVQITFRAYGFDKV